MADYKFYAFYVASKTGKSGLTVTIDVYKASNDSKVVDDQAVNEVSGGLYSYTYSSDTADDYMAVFKTTDATVDQQHIPALVIKQVPEIDNLALEATLTAIKGAGWSTETLKVIRDALTAAQADLDNPDQYKADVSAITGASLSAAGVGAILDEAVVGSYTLRQLLKVMAAAMAGKATGGGTTTVTFRGVDDASDVIVATVDANGNRSAVTLTV